jgi:hypothetical protein
MMLPLETVTRAVDMAYLGMEDDLQTWRERGGTQQAEHTLNSGNFWRLQYCGYTGRFQVSLLCTLWYTNKEASHRPHPLSYKKY